MQFVEVDTEALANGQHHLSEQGCPVSIVQAIKRPPEPIVAHVLHLLGIDAKHAVGELMHRLLLAIDRLPLDDERAQQDA